SRWHTLYRVGRKHRGRWEYLFLHAPVLREHLVRRSAPSSAWPARSGHESWGSPVSRWRVCVRFGSRARAAPSYDTPPPGGCRPLSRCDSYERPPSELQHPRDTVQPRPGCSRALGEDPVYCRCAFGIPVAPLRLDETSAPFRTDRPEPCTNSPAWALT